MRCGRAEDTQPAQNRLARAVKKRIKILAAAFLAVLMAGVSGRLKN